MDLWKVADKSEATWLIDLCGEEDTGFAVPPYPEGLWILHALYEAASEDIISEYQAASKAKKDLDEEPKWICDPGEGWRRLRWHELSERTGEPVVAQQMQPACRLPSFMAFPSLIPRSKLANHILWPDDGYMDRESFHRLAAVLRRFSGKETPVFAHYCALFSEDSDFPYVVEARLKDLETVETHTFSPGPANLWPADRSWVVYTDWDLWGTRVTGPPELLKMIVADDFLETVWLPLPESP
ncbi:hypothetical protein [Natronoglycomyces albus]|uniref:Uncharacterized protein n=1 Tax=Natronoglycomyces albus TaxID=2811108 RepID=A0A895XII8_9ACTN|nr:hypothetical protein [Natronoglycomyces albus]QSB05154.1 hypothetical protein JQS30_15575 [Natronoglycomyces albus]